MSNVTKWLLLVFGACVVILNAAESALFGAYFLAPAFGRGELASLLAALYCLLMLDAAYLIWFRVWLAGEQSTAQRDIALVLSVLALAGSIMATCVQLTVNTSLAPMLVPYRDTVGTVAFFVLLATTCAHIIGLAAHRYFAPAQLVATKTAALQARVIDTALDELEKRAQADTSVLVDALAGEFRLDVLRQLGFDDKLRRVGKQPALVAGEDTHTAFAVDAGTKDTQKETDAPFLVFTPQQARANGNGAQTPK